MINTPEQRLDTEREIIKLKTEGHDGALSSPDKIIEG